ncbi:MAG: hypothetical protein PHD45_09840 [Bacteroidales bacterium]|nr:hypothetical protein [Bacteroidales bacterium]
MKKLNLLLLPLFILVLFTGCKYDDYDVDDFDSKISELQAYNGDNVFEVIEKLEGQGLYVESDSNGLVQLTNSNGSIVYILIYNSRNKITESKFEYYTSKPTYALDMFGKWHNTAFNLNYTNYYIGEITFLDDIIKTFRSESKFMDDFEKYGADIYNCYEEWNSSYYGCYIEYSVINISTRKVSVGCFELDKKGSNKKE